MNKTANNKLQVVLISIVAVIALLWVGKNWIIKSTIETAVTAMTGFKTTLKGFDLTLPAKLHIQGLVIQNPSEFKTRTFADIPEIFIQMEIGELLKKERIHFKEIRLNIAQVNVEKTSAGVSNIERLASLAPKGPAGEAQPKKRDAAAMPFLVDRLELTMRKVHYSDASSVVPQNVSFDMEIDKQEFLGIADPAALVNMIVLKIVYGTTIGNLGIDPAALQGSVSDAMALGQDMLKQTSTVLANKAGTAFDKASSEFVANTPESLKGAATETKDTFVQAGQAAKDKVSGLFGGLKSKVSGSSSSE